ncbi:MAG: hypothetical protein ACLFVI_05720, partial [Archaeoglobaceae archaeon]
VLLGPDKLPEATRKMGKIYAEYNNAKKRFEMEVFQGQDISKDIRKDIPQKDFLERMSQKKFNSLKKDISSNITDTTKNYLNTESYNNKLDENESANKVSTSSASSQNRDDAGKSAGEGKSEEKRNKEEK